jgi:hypothetical protein
VAIRLATTKLMESERALILAITRILAPVVGAVVQGRFLPVVDFCKFICTRLKELRYELVAALRQTVVGRFFLETPLAIDFLALAIALAAFYKSGRDSLIQLRDAWAIVTPVTISIKTTPT